MGVSPDGGLQAGTAPRRGVKRIATSPKREFGGRFPPGCRKTSPRSRFHRPWARIRSGSTTRRAHSSRRRRAGWRFSAIGRHADRFRGRGLEWGSGSGILTIAAARIAWVEDVLGLELDPRGVAAAGENARRNGVDAKVRFVESDSYRPVSPEGRKALERFRGAADFILANPPSSSPVGDGFEVRRVVVRGAPEYLKRGGVLLLSVSTQYSAERVRGLVSANPGFVHEGVAATTDLVPFDMERPDLRRDVLTYAREEERGGLPYAFRDPRDPEREMTAVEAWQRHETDGESPLSRWQNHLLVWTG